MRAFYKLVVAIIILLELLLHTIPVHATSAHSKIIQEAYDSISEKYSEKVELELKVIDNIYISKLSELNKYITAKKSEANSLLRDHTLSESLRAYMEVSAYSSYIKAQVESRIANKKPSEKRRIIDEVDKVLETQQAKVGIEFLLQMLLYLSQHQFTV